MRAIDDEEARVARMHIESPDLDLQTVARACVRLGAKAFTVLGNLTMGNAPVVINRSMVVTDVPRYCAATSLSTRRLRRTVTCSTNVKADC